MRKLIGITSTPDLAQGEHHVQPVFPVLAHAEDPAAAQRQAGRLGDLQRIDAFAERVRADDVGIVAFGGFNVVIDPANAAVVKELGCLGREGAQRGAGARLALALRSSS